MCTGREAPEDIEDIAVLSFIDLAVDFSFHKCYNAFYGVEADGMCAGSGDISATNAKEF